MEDKRDFYKRGLLPFISLAAHGSVFGFLLFYFLKDTKDYDKVSVTRMVFNETTQISTNVTTLEHPLNVLKITPVSIFLSFAGLGSIVSIMIAIKTFLIPKGKQTKRFGNLSSLLSVAGVSGILGYTITVIRNKDNVYDITTGLYVLFGCLVVDRIVTSFQNWNSKYALDAVGHLRDIRLGGEDKATQYVWFTFAGLVIVIGLLFASKYLNDYKLDVFVGEGAHKGLYDDEYIWLIVFIILCLHLIVVIFEIIGLALNNNKIAVVSFNLWPWFRAFAVTISTAGLAVDSGAVWANDRTVRNNEKFDLGDKFNPLFLLMSLLLMFSVEIFGVNQYLLVDKAESKNSAVSEPEGDGEDEYKFRYY